MRTAADLQRDKEIAKEILNQLGGYGKLNAMVGLKYLVAEENGLSFRIKVAGAKCNFVKVTLTSMDLYKLELGKVHGASYNKKYNAEGLYYDQIKGIIERETGLRLSL